MNSECVWLIPCALIMIWDPFFFKAVGRCRRVAEHDKSEFLSLQYSCHQIQCTQKPPSWMVEVFPPSAPQVDIRLRVKGGGFTGQIYALRQASLFQGLLVGLCGP